MIRTYYFVVVVVIISTPTYIVVVDTVDIWGIMLYRMYVGYYGLIGMMMDDRPLTGRCLDWCGWRICHRIVRRQDGPAPQNIRLPTTEYRVPVYTVLPVSMSSISRD